MRKRFLIVLVSFSLIVGFSQSPQAADEDVAYIEEITVMPDGSQTVQWYRPGEKPIHIPVERGPEPEMRQRELTRVEKLELDQLEHDFEMGYIGESEFYYRRNQILKSTYVDAPPGDTPLEQQWRF